MTREEVLMSLIKSKYRSLHNFSLESEIPNSTLNSMFKKGMGGTACDTVMRVCSLLGCDIYSLSDLSATTSPQDYAFFTKYLELDDSSKELIKLVAEHQLSYAKTTVAPTAKELKFPEKPTLSIDSIKVYTAPASAGTGDYLEESEFIEIPFSRDIPKSADFGITIHGDSMMPSINDGDIVWLEQSEQVENEQIGVFVLNGDALCKKFVSLGGRIYLHSLNSRYRDIPITEYDDLIVIGTVIGSSPFPEN